MSKMREENDRLLKMYRAEENSNKKARLENQIVAYNMPFVKEKARRFHARSSVTLEVEDLLQAGAIGLLTAVRKDQGKSSFTTYAGWWIFHEFQNVVAKTQPVHRPKGAGMPYKSFRAIEAFKAMTGENATDEDLGLAKGTVDQWRQSPTFFPIDNSEEGASAEDRMVFDQPSADEILMQLESEDLLEEALDYLSVSERNNLHTVFAEGKGGDQELLLSSIEKLRLYLDDSIPD